MTRNLELEAAIAKDPESPAAYAVYADWLIERGEPRGELIQLQRMKKKEADALLEKHAAHFWGPLAEALELVTQIEWFIRRCRFANTYERYDGGNGDCEELMEAFVALPSLTFVRDLTVGILEFEGNGYTGFFEALEKSPKPTLKRLYVGDFTYEETELNWSSIGVTRPLWAAAPNLERLTLRSGSMSLEGIHAPELRELHIITGGFDSDSLAALCQAKWPNLETLQLGRDNKIEATELQPIFDGVNFPALRRLHLTNSTISDEIAERIPRSKIIAQLRTLDLSLGTLGEAGARALAAGKDKLAHLERLDVSESWINDAGLRALDGVCKKVITGDQRDDGGDPDNRYIAAYE